MGCAAYKAALLSKEFSTFLVYAGITIPTWRVGGGKDLLHTFSGGLAKQVKKGAWMLTSAWIGGGRVNVVVERTDTHLERNHEIRRS